MLIPPIPMKWTLIGFEKLILYICISPSLYKRLITIFKSVFYYSITALK